MGSCVVLRDAGGLSRGAWRQHRVGRKPGRGREHVAPHIVDAGEPRLASVTLDLTGIDDLGANVTASTTTGSDGTFSFTTLRLGAYTVTETGAIVTSLRVRNLFRVTNRDGSVSDEERKDARMKMRAERKSATDR